MRFQKHCPGCFRRKSGEAVCPHCGYDESLPRPPIGLPHGTLLCGRYRIGRVLGGPGRSGITYLGWDIQHQQRVAIKEFLPPELARRASPALEVSASADALEADFAARLAAFVEQAQTLAVLRHPNLPRLRELLHANDTAYQVADYYEGRALEAVLSSPRLRLDAPLACALLRSLASALRETHARGLLHRDLRPHNVHLAIAGRALLLDFSVPGLATDSPYAAPELRRAAAGPWTDVYGLGAILHRCLLGRPPPAAGQALEHQPRWSELSAALQELLRRSLAAQPQDRPADMDSLIELLDALDLPAPDTTAAIAALAAVPGIDSPAGPRIRGLELSEDVAEERDSLRYVLPVAALLSVLTAVGAWLLPYPDTARQSRPAGPTPLTSQERARLPQMIDIPPGRWQPAASPVAATAIAPFRMSRNEVTVEQFRLFVRHARYDNAAWAVFPCAGAGTGLSWENPGYRQADRFPVVCVSAADAAAFAQWMSRETGRRLRLPTEAEWEYALRAGTRTLFWWGDHYDDRYADCGGCGSRLPARPTYAASRRPNPFGLYDMAGNVREWTCSRFAADFAEARRCADGLDETENLVVRGGSWQEGVEALRSDYRRPFGAWHRNVWTGFRVVEEIDPAPVQSDRANGFDLATRN